MSHHTLPPDNDRDFQQLTGAFDRPVAPAPAFAERLKQQIAQSGATKGAPSMQASAPTQLHATRMTTGRMTTMPDPGRRIVRILEATAAAILILALIGGGFFINRNGNGTNNDPVRLAAVTGTSTPEPATPTPTESAWSDPGHTNAYPAGYDPATAQPAEPLGNLEFDSAYGIISGDTLILLGTPAGTTPGQPVLLAVDLITGQEKWTAERDISAIPVANNGEIFSIEGTQTDEDYKFELVALSAGTGEDLWTHTVFAVPEGIGLDIVSPYLYPVSSPIVIDDTVYIAKNSGDVAAFDTKTGNIVWKTNGWDDERDPEDVGGSLVGDDSYLYVVNGENTILKLDRQTGEIVDTLAENYRPAPNFILDLHLQGERLIMLARDSQHRPDSSSLLDVFSTTTGDALWSTKLRTHAPDGSSVGNMVISDNLIGIPHTVQDESTPSATKTASELQIDFLDIETGDLVSQYNPGKSDEASLSASGTVICIHQSSGKMSCVDSDETNPSLHGIDIGAPYNAEGPPSPVLFWRDSAIVLGHDGGPYIIRSGSNATEATPIASPVERQPEPARGGPFGTTADLNATYPDSALPTEPLARHGGMSSPPPNG